MLSIYSILDRIRGVEGWLNDAEAELLIYTAAHVVGLTDGGQTVSIVEVGSYCGKSTIAVGLALKNLLAQTACIYAIDPHEGEVTGADQQVMRLSPSFEKFSLNVKDAGVSDVIKPIRSRSYEVAWDQPIDLLFIDGLHDYQNVAADFQHFASWIRPRGCVAFHDYGAHFFGVKRFVDELISEGDYHAMSQAESLIVLEKKSES